MKAFGISALLVTALFIGAVTSAQAAGTDELAAKIQLAKTPADHEAIAQAYESEAKAALEKATEHKHMADSYSRTNAHRVPMATSHCESLAKEYAAIAADDTALAKLHREMATDK